MALSPDWGKPKPRFLRKRNFHTEALTAPQEWDRKKWTAQEKGGPRFKASRHQARTPYFSRSVRQPNPSLSKDTTKKKKKNHATHLHALVGKPGKFICVNRSNREQQNPQSVHRTHWNWEWAKVSGGQSRKREDAFARKSARQCRGNL